MKYLLVLVLLISFTSCRRTVSSETLAGLYSGSITISGKTKTLQADISLHDNDLYKAVFSGAFTARANCYYFYYGERSFECTSTESPFHKMVGGTFDTWSGDYTNRKGEKGTFTMTRLVLVK